MNKQYDMRLACWEKEQWVAPEGFDEKSKDHGYGKYVTLADRHIEFTRNSSCEIQQIDEKIGVKKLKKS